MNRLRLHVDNFFLRACLSLGLNILEINCIAWVMLNVWIKNDRTAAAALDDYSSRIKNQYIKKRIALHEYLFANETSREMKIMDSRKSRGWMKALKRKNKRLKARHILILSLGMATTGLAAGLLLNSEPAKKKRKELRKKAKNKLKIVKRAAQHKAENAADYIEGVKNKADEVLDVVQDKALKIKKDIKQSGLKIENDMDIAAAKISGVIGKKEASHG
jgi:uncharacterized membrane protein